MKVDMPGVLTLPEKTAFVYAALPEIIDLLLTLGMIAEAAQVQEIKEKIGGLTLDRIANEKRGKWSVVLTPGSDPEVNRDERDHTKPVTAAGKGTA